ncbi:unnamed protein product, partial [Rotaria magnacalcarata]
GPKSDSGESKKQRAPGIVGSGVGAQGLGALLGGKPTTKSSKPNNSVNHSGERRKAGPKSDSGETKKQRAPGIVGSGVGAQGLGALLGGKPTTKSSKPDNFLKHSGERGKTGPKSDSGESKKQRAPGIVGSTVGAQGLGGLLGGKPTTKSSKPDNSVNHSGERRKAGPKSDSGESKKQRAPGIVGSGVGAQGLGALLGGKPTTKSSKPDNSVNHSGERRKTGPKSDSGEKKKQRASGIVGSGVWVGETNKKTSASRKAATIVGLLSTAGLTTKFNKPNTSKNNLSDGDKVTSTTHSGGTTKQSGPRIAGSGVGTTVLGGKLSASSKATTVVGRPSTAGLTTKSGKPDTSTNNFGEDGKVHSTTHAGDTKKQSGSGVPAVVTGRRSSESWESDDAGSSSSEGFIESCESDDSGSSSGEGFSESWESDDSGSSSGEESSESWQYDDYGSSSGEGSSESWQYDDSGSSSGEESSESWQYDDSGSSSGEESSESWQYDDYGSSSGEESSESWQYDDYGSSSGEGSSESWQYDDFGSSSGEESSESWQYDDYGSSSGEGSSESWQYDDYGSSSGEGSSESWQYDDFGSSSGEESSESWQYDDYGSSSGEGSSESWQYDDSGSSSDEGSSESWQSDDSGSSSGEGSSESWQYDDSGSSSGEESSESWQSDDSGSSSDEGSSESWQSDDSGTSSGEESSESWQSDESGSSSGEGSSESSQSDDAGSSSGEGSSESSQSDDAGSSSSEGSSESWQSDDSGSSSSEGSSESSQSDESGSSSGEGSGESSQSDDSGSSSSEGSSESSQSDESGSSSGEGSSESSQSDKSGSSSGEDERVGVMNKSGKTQKQGGSGVRGVVAGGGSKKSGESDDSGNSSGEVGKVGGMNKSGKTQKQGGSGSVRSGVLVVVASGGFKKSGESVISGSSSGGVDTVDGGKGSKGDKVGGGKGKTVSIKATAAGIRGGSYVVQAVPLRAPLDVTTVRDVGSQHSSSDRRNVVRVAVANGQRNKKENNIVTEKLRTRIGQSGGKIITKILGICKAIVLGQTYRVTGEESNRIRDLTINSISMYDRTRNVDSRYSRLLHNLRRGRQFEQPSISKKSYTQNCAPQDIYVSYVYEYDMHNQVFNSSFQDPNSILIKGLQSDIARYTAEELYKRNLVPYVTDEAHLTKIMDVSKQYNDQAALRFYISIDVSRSLIPVIRHVLHTVFTKLKNERFATSNKKIDWGEMVLIPITK